MQTAEMPDFYKEGEYDLSGFAVGAVKKDKVIDGKNIMEGDIIIGLPSSGVHSNGFSLARRYCIYPIRVVLIQIDGWRMLFSFDVDTWQPVLLLNYVSLMVPTKFHIFLEYWRKVDFRWMTSSPEMMAW